MTLRQLRYIVETYRLGMNITRAAEGLNTSHPGVSKQIKLLEDSLNTQIFYRFGRRLTGATDKGRKIIEVAERILSDVENIKNISLDSSDEQEGNLTIATNHTLACHALPDVIEEFSLKFSNVRLRLKQSSPDQIVDDVRFGGADFAIYSSDPVFEPDLISIDCESWGRLLVTPPDHPLMKLSYLTLEDIVEFPIISFDSAYSGQSVVLDAIEEKNLKVVFSITGTSSEIIKTYTKRRMGVGIIPAMAYHPKRDAPLVSRKLDHLLRPSDTKLLFQKNQYLRNYTYEFIRELAPKLTRNMINQYLRGEITDN